MSNIKSYWAQETHEFLAINDLNFSSGSAIIRIMQT
jgi:hypothetical protein